MSLKSGIYTITTNLNDSPSVGRQFSEDRSLLPKRVVTLPPGVEPPHWVVEALSNGRYKLSIGGAHASEIDRKLFAVLIDEPKPTEWAVTQRDYRRPNTYTIAAPSGNGWVVSSEEPETQINVRPLIATTSIPPQFRPNTLFTFEGVNVD